MKKIRLIGLWDYKDCILNLLHKTGWVELTATEELADTFMPENGADADGVSSRYARLKAAVEFFTERVERCKGEPYYPTDASWDKLSIVPYDEFMAAPKTEESVNRTVDGVEEYKRKALENKSKLIKLTNRVLNLKPYAAVKEKFSDFKNTKYTTTFFGTVKPEAVDGVKKFLADFPDAEPVVLSEGQAAVIAVITLNENAQAIIERLNEVGFSPCPFTDGASAAEEIDAAKVEIDKINADEKATDKALSESVDKLKELKVYTDYYKFLLEKENANQSFRSTKKAFVLTGYVPEDKVDEVSAAVQGKDFPVFVEFSTPEKDDEPPTLLRNANPVKQTEFVTDMYSPPNYRELDPNKVVFFFFMLFMGVIMADVGYGILMIALGLFLALRIKIDSGARRLWCVIAASGVSSIVFGLLFNSVFGFSLPYTAPLPNPVPKGGDMDGLMTILLLCLGLGVAHIATGYFLKALNAFKDKDVAGGIFDGLVWVAFFIGLVFATFSFLVNYLMPTAYQNMNASVKSFFDKMAMPGLIIVVASVFIAMVTAGRKEKGFGKFSKGFGSVYGIISLMSDILSYARLFGLMLSGMIIASTFNDMGLSIASGGGIGYLFGGLVMIVGHLFNIAMGVLGAYIHNSRLQYIEFFGKFYTGEGTTFTPIGSKFDYVYLTK